MLAVGLVFAPLAPLVAAAAAVVFWVSSFVYKYQLMFVFVSKVESGGVSELNLRLKNLILKLFSAPMECSHKQTSVDCCLYAVVDGSK